MNSTQIKLCYRLVIDNSNDDPFSKAVLRTTYDEYLLKSQAYNTDGSCTTFAQLKAKDGRANSLHYKIGFAASGYMQTLQNKIPVLTDNLGNAIKFETFQFELIESDIADSTKHKLAILFFTPLLCLQVQMADYVVLSATEITSDNTGIECFTIRLQPLVSICYIGQTMPVFQHKANGSLLHRNSL